MGGDRADPGIGDQHDLGPARPPVRSVAGWRFHSGGCQRRSAHRPAAGPAAPAAGVRQAAQHRHIRPHDAQLRDKVIGQRMGDSPAGHEMRRPGRPASPRRHRIRHDRCGPASPKDWSAPHRQSGSGYASAARHGSSAHVWTGAIPAVPRPRREAGSENRDSRESPAFAPAAERSAWTRPPRAQAAASSRAPPPGNAASDVPPAAVPEGVSAGNRWARRSSIMPAGRGRRTWLILRAEGGHIRGQEP